MTPKNPKNGKKWQKGLKVQKIYLLVVPNQEFAPLEVKNEKTGTVGKSRSLSGQVLCYGKSPLSWPFSVTNLGNPDRV